MSNQIVKLEMAWGTNLYRVSKERKTSGYPVSVEHFNKDPEARQAFGRWSNCPNVNVSHRLSKAQA